jgi:hypothetical protein
MKKVLLSLILVSTMLSGLFAQTGSIRGRIIDSKTKETLPGASVYIENDNGKQGVTTDIYGYYHLKGLNPGVYNLNISYMGYQTQIITKIDVHTNKITSLEDVKLSLTGKDLTGVVITGKGQKLIDPETMTVIPSKEMKNIPDSRNLPKLISTITPGIYTTDDGRETYFRGARNGGVVYYVDGVKQRSSKTGIPSTAIANMMVYMGAVPAKYGDFDGGVVVIETKSYFDIEAERMMEN